MPNYVQKFASADVITQADFNTRTEDIENYVNGGIEGLDIDKTKWLDTKHVRSPAFYGSPAPRGEFVSGDVHYRRGARNEDQFLMWDTISTKFEPIFGLASTIHVTRQMMKITMRLLKQLSLSCMSMVMLNLEQHEKYMLLLLTRWFRPERISAYPV